MTRKQPARVARMAKGGRLTRSEVVAVRLDPKTRFAAEIAARSQRRTVSSLMEVALSEYLTKQIVAIGGKTEGEPLLHLIERVWDPDEPEHFVKFAQSCAWLLNAEEDRRWKYIQSVVGVHGPLTPQQIENLNKHYQAIVLAARGDRSALPKLVAQRLAPEKT